MQYVTKGLYQELKLWLPVLVPICYDTTNSFSSLHTYSLRILFLLLPDSTSNFTFGSYKPSSDPSKRQKMIYGVFNTPENSIQGSAVCAFTLDDVQKAFNGKFKVQATANHNWLSIPSDQTPNPHPAQSCVNDSKNLSNDVLEFIKGHPLMDMAVPAAGGAPVLMQTNEM